MRGRGRPKQGKIENEGVEERWGAREGQEGVKVRVVRRESGGKREGWVAGREGARGWETDSIGKRTWPINAATEAVEVSSKLSNSTQSQLDTYE